MTKNNYAFYHFTSSLIRFLGNLYFGGKVIGSENIPKEGRCILAGNHVSNFDSYLLFLACKRPIHILGKIELFKGPFGFIFKWMHLIPVDRSKKNKEAINIVNNILKEDKVVGIFPEATFHKEGLLLPFKSGVINFSKDNEAPIIPFAIIGKFHFRSHPKIVFGKPITIKEGINDNVKYLEEVILSFLKNG